MLSSFKAVVPIELMAVQMFFVSPSSFNVAGRRATEFVKAFCFACVARRSADICAAWSRDATIANTLWIALSSNVYFRHQDIPQFSFNDFRKISKSISDIQGSSQS